MEEATISNLTQSRYYSPSFNAAIYDGAIRVYFAQYQETEALKIYFKIQEKMKETQSLIESDSACVFVMLYPDADSYATSFGDSKNKVEMEKLEAAFVVGINGPVLDDDFVVYDEICRHVLNAVDKVYLKVSPLEVVSESSF